MIPLNPLLISLFAATLAGGFINNPTWLAVQRYFIGVVLAALAALAARLMLEQRRSA